MQYVLQIIFLASPLIVHRLVGVWGAALLKQPHPTDCKLTAVRSVTLMGLPVGPVGRWGSPSPLASRAAGAPVSTLRWSVESRGLMEGVLTDLTGGNTPSSEIRASTPVDAPIGAPVLLDRS